MSTCEICGKDDQLYVTAIEKTELQLCKSCSGYGTVKRVVQQEQKKAPIKNVQRAQVKEIVYLIVEDYANIVKKKREELNLTQDEFAKKLNEKASLLHNIESGHHEPSIDLAHKLEKMLHIKLIEQYTEKNEKLEKAPPSAYTLGDFIKVKK